MYINNSLYISNTNFSVNSATNPNTYHIDMNIGICSCVVGCKGGSCEHQAAIII